MSTQHIACVVTKSGTLVPVSKDNSQTALEIDLHVRPIFMRGAKLSRRVKSTKDGTEVDGHPLAFVQRGSKMIVYCPYTGEVFPYEVTAIQHPFGEGLVFVGSL